MRKLATLLAVFFVCVLPLAAAEKPLEARLAAQNALFTEYWETTLKLNPTLATSVGDYRYNDKLGDTSLAGIAHRHDVAANYLARFKAIPTDGFD